MSTRSGLAELFPLLHARFMSSDDPRLDWLRDAAVRLEFLPLYWDWTHAVGIAPDGALVSWEHDAGVQELKPLTDAKYQRLAIVQGAKTHPELASFIPVRPARAIDCASCNSTGQIAGHPTLICNCVGLGWLIPGEPG